MNDDELGRRLRSEVPPPGPGYWEVIEARLADAETPSSDGDRFAGGWRDSEDVDSSGDTDPNVIRLRTMDTTTSLDSPSSDHPSHDRPSSERPSRAGGLRILAAAAAVTVIAGAGAVFATNRGQDRVVQPGITQPANPRPAITPPPMADPLGRRLCYSGGELAEGITAYVDIDRKAQLEAIVRHTDAGRTEYSFATGTLLDDVGRAEVNVRDPGLRRADQWIIDDKGLSLADDVYVVAVDCDTIVGDLVAMAAARQGAPTPAPSSTPSNTPSATGTAPETVVDRFCFSGDGRSLVLTFAGDLQTFRGALRITTDGTNEYQAVTGRRVWGPTFRVAVQRLGIGADRIEDWVAGTTGDVVLGDGTSLAAVGCASIADDVADLDARVSTFPPVPS